MGIGGILSEQKSEEEEEATDPLDYKIPEVGGLMQKLDEAAGNALRSEHAELMQKQEMASKEDQKKGKKKAQRQRQGGIICCCGVGGCTIGPMVERS
jgi:hypothetical protein